MAPVISVGSVRPEQITVSRNTVTKAPQNRKRFRGGALRNSMMEGKFELYSIKTRKLASKATSRMICVVSADTPGSISAGVAIINATKRPRMAAPVSRAITSRSLQTGQTRYVAANLFQLDSTVCGGLPHSCPICAFFRRRAQVRVKANAIVKAFCGNGWCHLASEIRHNLGIVAHLVSNLPRRHKRGHKHGLQPQNFVQRALPGLRPRDARRLTWLQSLRCRPLWPWSGRCRPDLPAGNVS